MGKQDLRTWIADMEAAGEVQHISGADREEEIGGIGRSITIIDCLSQRFEEIFTPAHRPAVTIHKSKVLK